MSRYWVFRERHLHETVMVDAATPEAAIEQAATIPTDAWDVVEFTPAEKAKFSLSGVSLSDEREPYRAPVEISTLDTVSLPTGGGRRSKYSLYTCQATPICQCGQQSSAGNAAPSSPTPSSTTRSFTRGSS